MDEHFRALHHWLIKFHSQPRSREELEAVYTRVWDEQEFLRDFEIVGFVDETVEVHRKADGAHGSLTFQDCPRFYFCWIDVL